jgi:hypothetical protein
MKQGVKKMKIVIDIEKAFESDFSLVEMTNGHRHTIKAYGSWNQWSGSDDYDRLNQEDYINYIIEHERTEVDHYEIADSEQDAIESEIIEEEGGFI